METTQISLIKNTTIKYKLIVLESLEQKIRYLCEKCPNIEYSGVLFYNYTGGFDNKNLIIQAKDFYLMDIGSIGYTEFNNSPDVVNYMALNPKLLDCKIGLLHSHNSMSTYFSVTDINTLKEEGLLQENFVSLIVNNKGEYTAAVTRRIKGNADINFKGNSSLFGDTVYSVNKQDSIAKEFLEYFELDIEIPKVTYTVDLELEERYEELKAKKENIIKPNISHSNDLFSSYKYYSKYQSDIDNNSDNKIRYIFYKILTLNPLLSTYKVDLSEYNVYNICYKLYDAFPDLQDYSIMASAFLETAIIPKMLNEKGIIYTENLIKDIIAYIDDLTEEDENDYLDESNDILLILKEVLTDINLKEYGQF
jgi:predicted nucleic-acid-binding Zn-ribbon protein